MSPSLPKAVSSMGNIVEKVSREYLGGEEKVRDILIIGLEESGKSQILWRLSQSGFDLEVREFAGFFFVNMETVKFNRKKFHVRDYGGRRGLPTFPNHQYLKSYGGLIFVVDCSNEVYVIESKAELWRILQDEELKDIPVLIIANKQDSSNAISTAEVAEKMEIESMKDRRIYVQGSSFSETCSYEDLRPGFTWLFQNISFVKKNSKSPMKHEKKEKKHSDKKKHHPWLSIFQT